MFISKCSKNDKKIPRSHSELQSTRQTKDPSKHERISFTNLDSHQNISHNFKSNENIKKTQKSFENNFNYKKQSFNSCSQSQTSTQTKPHSVFRPIQILKNEIEDHNSKKNKEDTKLGKWSFEEQNRCFNLFLDYLADWKLISEKLKNRNLNSIKNLFYSSIRSIKKSFSGTFFKKLVNSSCKSFIGFVNFLVSNKKVPINSKTFINIKKDLQKMKVFTKLLMKEIVYIEHPSAYKYIIKLLFSSISKPLNLNKIKILIEDLDLKNKLEFDYCIKDNTKSPTVLQNASPQKSQIKRPIHQKFDLNYPLKQKMNVFSHNPTSFLENHNLSNKNTQFRTFPHLPNHLVQNNLIHQTFDPRIKNKINYLCSPQINNDHSSHIVNPNFFFDRIKFYKQRINYLEKQINMSQYQERHPHMNQRFYPCHNVINYTFNDFSRNTNQSCTNSQNNSYNSYGNPNMTHINKYMSGNLPS